MEGEPDGTETDRDAGRVGQRGRRGDQRNYGRIFCRAAGGAGWRGRGARRRRASFFASPDVWERWFGYGLSVREWAYRYRYGFVWGAIGAYIIGAVGFLGYVLSRF